LEQQGAEVIHDAEDKVYQVLELVWTKRESQVPTAKKQTTKATTKIPVRGARAVRAKKEAVFPSLRPPVFEDSDEY
jgi:hypothetical protein